jgi:filamentous hemagglutinin family protein
MMTLSQQSISTLTSALLTTALLITNAAAQPAPDAQPTGGVVAAGSATVTQSPTQTTVTQSSASAVVNWQSFDVGSAQSVTFAQPASSRILDRNIGAAASQIAGTLSANGDLYLVNPAGIFFFRGPAVNTGGTFVASTWGISNADFQSGNFNFDQPSPNNVEIQRTINVAPGGFAQLIGNLVVNTGTINVPSGTLVAGGANFDITGRRSFLNNQAINLGFASVLNVAGSLTLSEIASQLSIELAGTTARTFDPFSGVFTGPGLFSQISEITGATLAGELDVSLAGLFAPQSGDFFDILVGTNITGDFTTLDLPTLSAGLMWEHGVVDLGGGLEAYRLDVAGVPEPSTWAMMLLGFAFRRKVSFA